MAYSTELQSISTILINCYISGNLVLMLEENHKTWSSVLRTKSSYAGSTWLTNLNCKSLLFMLARLLTPLLGIPQLALALLLFLPIVDQGREKQTNKKKQNKKNDKKNQPPTYTVCNLGNIGTRFKSSCPQSNLHDSGLTRGILGSHHLNLRLRSSHKKQCQATKAQLATVLLRKGSK